MHWWRGRRATGSRRGRAAPALAGRDRIGAEVAAPSGVLARVASWLPACTSAGRLLACRRGPRRARAQTGTTVRKPCPPGVAAARAAPPGGSCARPRRRSLDLSRHDRLSHHGGGCKEKDGPAQTLSVLKF
jgi:hypothetical protein